MPAGRLLYRKAKGLNRNKPTKLRMSDFNFIVDELGLDVERFVVNRGEWNQSKETWIEGEMVDRTMKGETTDWDYLTNYVYDEFKGKVDVIPKNTDVPPETNNKEISNRNQDSVEKIERQIKFLYGSLEELMHMIGDPNVSKYINNSLDEIQVLKSKLDDLKNNS